MTNFASINNDVIISHRSNTEITQIFGRETATSQTDGLPSRKAILVEQGDPMIFDLQQRLPRLQAFRNMI